MRQLGVLFFTRLCIGVLLMCLCHSIGPCLLLGGSTGRSHSLHSTVQCSYHGHLIAVVLDHFWKKKKSNNNSNKTLNNDSIRRKEKKSSIKMDVVATVV